MSSSTGSETTAQLLRVAILGYGLAGAPQPPPKSPEVSPFKVKMSKDLAKVTETLPTMIFSVERKPDSVTLIMRQPNLKSASAKIINQIVNASLERLLNPGAGEEVEAVPAPPPPPPPKQ